MPRPSKHVSPDTLGGRIRAAREHQHLSLADVASGHYSTSLISQIERNRVDPSHESLRFLAERLQLPVHELEVLAQQHRETEVEARQYVSYDALRSDAARLLAEGKLADALQLLEKLHLAQIPSLQRWRLAALRGQCYFAQREFVKAQEDLIYATQEEPEGAQSLSSEQRQEMVLLHLRLAGTYRALNQLEKALEQFQTTLDLVDRNTPFGYVAEAQWETSLIEVAQANIVTKESYDEAKAARHRIDKLHDALEHANNALHLYRSIGEMLEAAALTCHIARIQQELGQKDLVQQRLHDLLTNWSAELQQTSPENASLQQAQANIVSAAASMLAEIALGQDKLAEASNLSELALEAAKKSYKVRQADAYTIRGQILAAEAKKIVEKHPKKEKEQEAVKNFQEATHVLARTERIGARIRAHVQLGTYLYDIGDSKQGTQELDEASRLSTSVLTNSETTPDTRENARLVESVSA